MKVRDLVGKWSLLLTSLMALSSSLIAYSQTNQGRTEGIPEDWTHHHVVFSDPGSEENAWRTGTMERWSKIVNDRRYLYQQQRRRMGNSWPRERNTDKSGALKTDWGWDLGSGAALGQNQYPAKYSFSINTASCSDYVIYPTGLAGSATQATIVAFNNLYEGGTCTGTQPNIYWAYNTGGTATTSPVLYSDGQQVAYIQTNTSNVASLVILTMANSSGTVGNPAAINSVSTSNYKGCVGVGAPCYTTITLSGSPNDTNSAPYYDYDTDTLYVGDNSGKLHKFIHIFGQGTAAPAPSEVTTGGWPVTVSATAGTLTGPVYDAGTSKNVFVGDSQGFVYGFAAASGALQWKTSRLTASTSVGIYDAPMVDSTAEKVYVSVGDDANTTGSIACDSTTGCSGVFQFPAAGTTTGTGACTATSVTAWPGGSYCGEEAVFGVGIYPNMYDGAFDNTYYNGTGTTGNLWECSPAYPGGTVKTPRLNVVPLQTNGGIVTSGDVLEASATFTKISALASNGSATCSPVTEFLNNGNSTAVTTYSGSLNATDTSTTITVGSSTNIAIGNYIKIDNEIMLVSAIPSGTSITAKRGTQSAGNQVGVGTTEATHTGPGNVFIPAIDYIYFSVTSLGNLTPNAIGCTGACLYSAAVGTATTSFTTFNVPTNGVAEAGGTSGIIIDNDTTAAGESQIYFTTLANQACSGNSNGTLGTGTGGCATQTAQSAP